MPRSDLARRVAVAAIGIPIAAAAIFAGGYLLGALLMLVAAGAAHELYRLSAGSGYRPIAALGTAGAAGFVLAATVAPDPARALPFAWSWLLILTLAAAAVAIPARGVGGRPLEAVSVTVFGAVYTGGTLAFALFLRHLPVGAAGEHGLPWIGVALVAFPVLLTWVNDTAAYVVGRRWGRRPLSPRVSPKKTVEGAVAGLAAAVALGAAYAGLVLQGWLGLPVGTGLGAAGGAAIGVAAQVGDLAESLWKRAAGVKDSGTLLPGHGGLLDRFDALFFTVPVAYGFFAVLLVGRGAP